jgi:hypothetical protein
VDSRKGSANEAVITPIKECYSTSKEPAVYVCILSSCELCYINARTGKSVSKNVLKTLGYNENNNTVLKNCLNSEMGLTGNVKDQRGHHEPANKLSEDRRAQMFEHVESFHPCIPHYRRAHAPNRRYLASDVTITAMYEDFIEKFDFVISRETYRKVVSDMNIGFTQLSGEECEVCTSWTIHSNGQCNVINCETCLSYHVHKACYTRARQEYSVDKELSEESHCVCSADLMKVMMIPHIYPASHCIQRNV